jgi:large subunit ribosomal protein L3
MVNGIIGKKVGMTQLFLEDGTVEPATVLKAGPCVVVQGKSAQTDGYEAVQIGLVEAAGARPTRPWPGHFKKANVPPTRVRREVKLAKGAEAPTPASRCWSRSSTQGERVDVIGTSKGHGFQGVVKRHHFRGGDATHGSMFHRAPGLDWRLVVSVAGHQGHADARAHGRTRVTTRNLKVLRVDAENNLIVVRGAVPGRQRRLRAHSQGRRGQAGAAAAAAGEAQEGQEVAAAMTVDVESNCEREPKNS